MDRLHDQRDVLHQLRRSQHPNHLVAGSAHPGIHPAQQGGSSMTRHLVVVAVPAELTLLVATIGLALVRVRERPPPGVLLDISPPERATATLPRRPRCYRSAS